MGLGVVRARKVSLYLRDALRNSLCISIAQDKRASRFLMRFRCADASLNIFTGIIAHMRDAGDMYHNGADAVRKATISGLQRICTSLPAPITSGRRPDLDEKLFRLVAGKVECFAADGASDQQLAGNESWPS